MNNNIGIITEQGDLGYGFDLLNDKDAKTYNESTTNKEDNKSNKEDK